MNTTSAVELRHFFMSGVGMTVVGLLYAISFASAATFAMLIIRNWREKRFQEMEAEYGQAIVSDLLDGEAGAIPLVKNHRPKWYQWLRRRSLKTILLNHIRSISGPEKVLLVQSYCILGYANKDRDNCYSMFWWRRLEGISSLSGLDIHDSALIFDELRKDREELVSLAATLALSSMRHPRNNAAMLRKLPARAIHRRNLLLQIANNWAHVYGPQFVFERLRVERRDEMIRVFVAALAELNSFEVGSELTTWMLADDRRREPQTLVYILRTLKTIGDPASVSVAESLLKHADETVRSEAMDLIGRLGDESEIASATEKMSKDTSVAVQRVLRHIHEKKVAA